jgi:hypothetical protein
MPDWWADSDALRDMLVESGRMTAPRRTFELHEIRPGWPVYDSDREPIGSVLGLVDRYLVVGRHPLWRYWLTRLYVPESAIGEAHEGVVILNVPEEWLASMGWQRKPRERPRAHH